MGARFEFHQRNKIHESKLFQSPPAMFVQVTVAACAALAMASNASAIKKQWSLIFMKDTPRRLDGIWF
jgi:hypothetical protein